MIAYHFPPKDKILLGREISLPSKGDRPVSYCTVICSTDSVFPYTFFPVESFLYALMRT